MAMDVVPFDWSSATEDQTRARHALYATVKAEFDPREEPEPYAYFRIVPQRIQAWRESNELAARVLMRDGRWLE